MRITNNTVNFKGREIFVGPVENVEQAYKQMKQELGNVPIDYQNINPGIPQDSHKLNGFL